MSEIDLNELKRPLKLNFNLEYQRLVPAVAKLPKKRKIKDIDGGITGKSLFDRIKERAKLNKDIKILIVIDDSDCKIKSSKRYNLMS